MAPTRAPSDASSRTARAYMHATLLSPPTHRFGPLHAGVSRIPCEPPRAIREKRAPPPARKPRALRSSLPTVHDHRIDMAARLCARSGSISFEEQLGVVRHEHARAVLAGARRRATRRSRVTMGVGRGRRPLPARLVRSASRARQPIVRRRRNVAHFFTWAAARNLNRGGSRIVVAI